MAKPDKPKKDFTFKKKMKPYSSDQTKRKYKLEHFNSDGSPKVTTKTEKLIIKNANRSLKKGLRQQAKKDIQDAISEEE